MRIVQLVLNLEIGGLERLAIDLARQQEARGHEALIYCLQHRGALADQAEAAGISVITFDKPGGISPTTLWRLVQQLRRDRPDVLHAHNHTVQHYAVPAGRLAGVPVIVNTRHREEIVIREENGRYVRTEKSSDAKADLLFKATLPWTDAVVMIASNTRDFFVQRRGIPADKTHVILNGAPVEKFHLRPAHPGAEHPRIRFGTAGRMIPHKDQLSLIEAFARVTREVPHAELHIAGDGPLRTRVEERVKKYGLENRVQLHGPVIDMPGFFSQLDVFVLSSLSEGLPIVILEAMAAGLPIVSTRCGGVAEAAIEGKNALFCEIGDVEGLAQRMIEMARRGDLAEAGGLGRRIVADRFTIENTWNQYEALFSQLQRTRPRNSRAMSISE